MVSLTLGPKSYGTKVSNNVNIVAPTLIAPSWKRYAQNTVIWRLIQFQIFPIWIRIPHKAQHKSPIEDMTTPSNGRLLLCNLPTKSASASMRTKISLKSSGIFLGRPDCGPKHDAAGQWLSSRSQDGPVGWYRIGRSECSLT